MSEPLLHSNQIGTEKPAWSFMALHSKNPALRSTISNPPSNGTQEGLVFGKQARLNSFRIDQNAKDVSELKLQSSEDSRLHTLDLPSIQPAPGIEFHGRKTAGVVGDMSCSSDSLASTSGYSVRDNALNTAGLFSYSSKYTKGDLRHNASAASRPGPESPTADDSEYINDDRHTPRALSTIPYSFEDSDSKIDTAETMLRVQRDGMSSDDFHGCRSQNELQPRSVSMSNDHLTDQNGMQALVLEAMKTIQKYEVENEKQRQELNRLGTVILDLQSEKERLVDKVTTLKRTTIQKVAACSQALKDQGEELRTLKLKSEELFATTPEECRALLQEIHQLKDTISESIESVQEYLNPEKCINMRDNDHIIPSGPVTREILSALRNEIQNKQQVLDMLRDRLSDALSDVAVLRTHTFQMQEAYSAECLAVKLAKKERDMRDTRIAELLDELNNQRTECLKALTQAAELELKYQSQQQQDLEQDSIHQKLQVEVDLRLQAEKCVIEQDAIVQTQKTSLDFLEKIKKENFQLSSDLASRTERLKLLDASEMMVKTLSDENENLKNEAILRDLKIREYEVKLASLETISAKSEKEIEEQKSTINEFRDVISSNERVISELKNSMLNYQNKVDRIECLLTQTKEELSTSLEKAAVITESEKALQTRCLEVTKEKEALSLQLQKTSQKLEQVLAYKDQEIQTEIHSQLKSLREQFEDQNATLRLVREANADLQERLMSAVADYTRKLEETRGNFLREMAILEERNSSLHSQLEREKESVSGLQTQLSQKDLEIEKHLKESKQRSESFYLRLHQDLQSLQERKSSLEIQLHQEKATYQAQYSDFQIKEAERLREINELHTNLNLRTQYEVEMKECHDREQLDSRSQIELLQTRLSDLDKKSNSLPLDCFEHEQEIHRLRAHVHQIQAENEMVRDRMITLSLRYDSGDLDVAERTLVQKIMKGIQAVHDQEIAKLKNELHRKDGLIASLEVIKTSLENSLRKKLQKKSPLVGTNTFETSEFINWPSSPLIHPAPTTHLGKQDELTKTPSGERQDGTLLYPAPQQPVNRNSPLSTAPITALQDSNDNLALGDLAAPGSTSDTIAMDTQRPPKRPKTAGRNTQTNSSRNKRKRRN